MTTLPLSAALDDARALLDTLLTSNWQDAHVVSGGTEIFIARDGGRPNPMRRAANAPAKTSAAAAVAAPALTEVAAPHVATLVDSVAVGARIVSGQVIATIRVLDADEPIFAPCSGTVTAVAAASGAMLEFGTPIMTLSEAA